ncbi:MAG TPA: protein kinase [Thermoanaerobaculia bacterium]|nr:protein kinase [Thermoanaerobaculia bacterium]
MIGSTVSRYRILERLGGGGMGVVYKAEDLKLGRPVALKFLAAQRGENEADRRRFLREARAASALDHSGICTIYEIDESDDGRLFIAMAFCEGETLKRHIARGPLPPDEAVDLAVQVAAGLARAHERGIVHRDVKPANLMVTPGGQVRIVDFGIAHLEGQTRLTRPGAAVGTAAYMAPEVFRSEPVDARSDIWSLGVVIYEMLTGEVPFQGEHDGAVIDAILRSDPPPLETVRPGLPPALQRVIDRCLAKPSHDRYTDMEELRRDLLAIQQADATVVEVRSPGSRGTTQPKVASGSAAQLGGRVVGHYQVLEQLGGGGMGVVYRAEDTRLERLVALKFLPSEISRDPEVKARFFQEARVASALDHPNVCTIHEVGEAEDGRLYLAMACYDGETLRTRLKRGPLGIDEAVEIALQIARGLAKAHRQGIVHRDIKPANLMITSDEVVKILDFGLAKLIGAAALTRSGTSLGTPAYMSPEQARTDDVDARTDIWALGVVLYEMLSGRRPFRGERDQAILYSLLHEEPEPLSRLRPEVPPDLEAIVRRMMEKDPDRRPATMAEVVADLQAFRGPVSGPVTRSLRARPPRRPWARPALAGGLALALAAGGFLAYRLGGGGGESEPLPNEIRKLTDLGGSESSPSFSPQGDTFVYTKANGADVDIYYQRVDGGTPFAIGHSDFADTQPAYSPDGRQIAFRSERNDGGNNGGIFLMGATGESPRRLSKEGFNPAWSPDGKEIVFATGPGDTPASRSDLSHLVRIDVATGEMHPLETGTDAVQPSWSPNGLRIAYWGLLKSQRVIWTIPAEGGEPVRVTADDDTSLNWDPVWSPQGHYLYFASDRNGGMNLWRVRIDERSGRVLGEPESVTKSTQPVSLMSLDKRGRILFATQDRESNLFRGELDSVQKKVLDLVPLTATSDEVRSGDFSPDDREIVFDTSGVQEDLSVLQADGKRRQLTDDPAKDRFPRWSPDGKRILFYTDRTPKRQYEAWTIRPDGSDLQPVARAAGPLYASVWSPRGDRIASNVDFKETVLFDLTQPLERRLPQPLPVRSGPAPRFGPSSWSPDGRWLAGQTGEPGIVVYSFPEQRYERLTQSGESPVWLGDSRTLLFLQDGKIFGLDAVTKRTWEVLAPPANYRFTLISPGRRGLEFCVVRAKNEGDIHMLDFKPEAPAGR